jgi:hypothetical protein
MFRVLQSRQAECRQPEQAEAQENNSAAPRTESCQPLLFFSKHEIRVPNPFKRKASPCLYKKNIPVWERVMRVFAGAMMVAAGLYWLPGQMLGYLVAAMGVMAALTGFVGYCPMCSIAGRKLPEK